MNDISCSKMIENTILFDKYTIQKTYQFTRTNARGKKISVIDLEELEKINFTDIVKGNTYSLERIDADGKEIRITNEQEVKEILEDKTLVARKYRIFKMNSKGVNRLLTNHKKIKKVLNGKYMAGSISFTRDTRHRGWIHKALHFGQKFHSTVFRRKRKLDNELCHGTLIIGKGIKKKDKPHSYLLAHSVFQGIRTANRDYLVDFDTTDLVIYRPKDKQFRDKILRFTESTAFIENKESRTPRSPKEKPKFSLSDMFLSFFKNKKHKICEKHRRIPTSVIRRTAKLLADFILDTPILNSNGNKPERFFCSPYVMSVAQGSFILQELEKDSSLGIAKEAFISNNGVLLSRKNLSKKILSSLKVKDSSNPFASKLFEIYHQHKLARIDGKYLMSGYAAKLLDKHTFNQKDA